MVVNTIPKFDMSDNPTNCCPRFTTDGWNGQHLHFKDKTFVKAVTRSVFYIPVNMGSVSPETLAAINNEDAQSDEEYIVLSLDTSP